MAAGAQIAIVFGTRPEIIKLSPLISCCQRRGIPFVTIHSGQHYSYEMDRLFFEQLGLPDPNHSLEVRSTAPYRQGQHTGRMMEQIEGILLDEKPANVIVQGDTNTVLATSLVTAKIGTVRQLIDFAPRLGHVEACLRSYDTSMPEEMNRVMADHLSDLLFAPTEEARLNGLKESIPREKILVTGNTVVDALRSVEEQIDDADALGQLGLAPRGFALLTLHRQENVDVKERFTSILEGVAGFAREAKLPAIWPVHPRAKKMISVFEVEVPAEIRMVDPLGFFEFLSLERDAAIALTDSGGVQEETCIFGTPCVTLRDNTERPETVAVGANVIAGSRALDVAARALEMLARRGDWEQPFGDGAAGERIVDYLLEGKETAV